MCQAAATPAAAPTTTSATSVLYSNVVWALSLCFATGREKTTTTAPPAPPVRPNRFVEAKPAPPAPPEPSCFSWITTSITTTIKRTGSNSTDQLPISPERKERRAAALAAGKQFVRTALPPQNEAANSALADVILENLGFIGEILQDLNNIRRLNAEIAQQHQQILQALEDMRQ
eukprot:gnl/MRDRNA2_/MRDRNA2_146373_c0_seq1.p1 gnl/MRDRNA2_/MRDRNA2_146373_c0~~gnl/MRDRNA2_/MRDRNA2_146373_c0_seq1.p1  ORF type:complete len:174 (+),score=45.14 gnl/MRDRNA2_/MRDRNA2_146373_c0_seq1:98-619(+)